MADAEILRVQSEDEAFAILQRAMASEFSDEAFPIVVFDGWPVLDVYLPQTPVQASITPTMMGAFIDLQEAVYRAHKLVNADTGNLRTLSKAEREAYEFRVRVSPGSSGYSIDLTEVLTKIGAQALAKMTPESLIIVVLGVALITGGTVAFKAWLKTRAEVRKAEIEAETTKSTSQDDQEERIRFYEVIENQTRANERNFGLLVEAIRREPVLGDIDAATEPARHRIVKAVSEENGGRVAGVDLPAGTAAEVTHTKRQESVEVQIDGQFRVAKVDTTVPDGFRVTLSREGQDDVVASVLDVMKSEQQRLLLKEAEWNKRPVFVAISARKLRSRIVDAVIEDVRPIADHDVA